MEDLYFQHFIYIFFKLCSSMQSRNLIPYTVLTVFNEIFNPGHNAFIINTLKMGIRTDPSLDINVFGIKHTLYHC